jgi:ketosteroid isomerase-like protein
MAIPARGIGVVTIDRLKAFLEAFNRHDLDAIMDFFADDCVMEGPRGPEPWGLRLVGKDQVREGCRSRLEGMPDVHYGMDRHWAFGDKGISEWTITGTTRSGEKVEARGTDHLEFRGGKIVRKDSYWKIVEGRP